MSAITLTPRSRDTRLGNPFASQLIGVWALVSYSDEQPGREDAHPFGPEPQGFLIYTADGFVSAQLMRPRRPAFCSSDWHHGTLQELNAARISPHRQGRPGLGPGRRVGWRDKATSELSQ
jgi:hypothetical protein